MNNRKRALIFATALSTILYTGCSQKNVNEENTKETYSTSHDIGITGKHSEYTQVNAENEIIKRFKRNEALLTDESFINAIQTLKDLYKDIPLYKKITSDLMDRNYLYAKLQDGSYTDALTIFYQEEEQNDRYYLGFHPNLDGEINTPFYVGYNFYFNPETNQITSVLTTTNTVIQRDENMEITTSVQNFGDEIDHFNISLRDYDNSHLLDIALTTSYDESTSPNGIYLVNKPDSEWFIYVATEKLEPGTIIPVSTEYRNEIIRLINNGETFEALNNMMTIIKDCDNKNCSSNATYYLNNGLIPTQEKSKILEK